MLTVAKKPARVFDGEALRRLRTEQELTQAELAERVGVHVVNLSQYERGKVVPSFDVACRLADALGVDVAVFRKGE
ncbi:xre family transcriptional regulator : Transcriptional regulator, XRE family OS=Sphaerobacter thermophilus (strain DSM 20745 / S 6022) GN=Sthe_2021 PE=4 SV=1: HTH_31 [Gemmataceae bacterium]|nr:xre family transcriptional regulator : Transcriptional regulator, XRE family OS=Sphaerobacter thermophilus (strain DSM 20745 / S 6022) GN=Sthe_2021 PE=4 SV=1: HTH_31 [Gemmataceae bacterium]VTT99003.1 xre family transcriptional regulator : Transcriptional regulator, XRE family OS=Sphaerobacter thermophilus (strain DSM 20745 / S 6022) GN=Sthe_2021 PE=4 SV=1: HTH_31 [Gemmataceae bacterium]